MMSRHDGAGRSTEVVEVILSHLEDALVSDDPSRRWWAIRCRWLALLDRHGDMAAIPGAPSGVRETYSSARSLASKLVVNPDSAGAIIDWAVWAPDGDEWHPYLLDAATHQNTLPVTMLAIAREIHHWGAFEAHDALLRRYDIPGEVVEQLFRVDELPYAWWDDADPYLFPRAYLSNPGHDRQVLTGLVDVWLRQRDHREWDWPAWVTRARVLPGMGDEDDDVVVLSAIAANPSLSGDDLRRIVVECAVDDDARNQRGQFRRSRAVACGVAANPASPAELLERVARWPLAIGGNHVSRSEGWERVRHAVSDGDLHQALAANPATPAPMLLGLAAAHPELAAAVATNHALGESLLLSLPARAVLNCRHQPDAARLVPPPKADAFARAAAASAAEGPTVGELLAII